jgi:hypothetical protein
MRFEEDAMDEPFDDEEEPFTYRRPNHREKEGNMKPNEYRESYTLVRNAPYQIDDDGHTGTPWSGGVLNIGRVIYLDQQAKDKKPGGSVSAYAEGIGAISLDSRFLVRAKRST